MVARWELCMYGSSAVYMYNHGDRSAVYMYGSSAVDCDGNYVLQFLACCVWMLMDGLEWRRPGLHAMQCNIYYINAH